MPTGSELRLAHLAGKQLGLFTRAQALELGLPYHVIRSRLRTHSWEELHKGVYRSVGVPGAGEQFTFAAVLAAGPRAVASHRSAAVFWGLRGVPAVAPEVTVPYECNPAPSGVRVYRSRSLGPSHVTRVGPVPITTPVRTLLDLGDVLGAESLEDALDDALQRDLVSISRLSACLEGARCGLRGVRKLRSLLEIRTDGHLGESTFENRVRRFLVASGLPTPLAQFVVRDDDGRFIARVDLAYPKTRLAIEADGYAFHSGRRAFERDRERQNALVNAGWRVLRVTPNQLDNDASAFAGVVARALDLTL